MQLHVTGQRKVACDAWRNDSRAGTTAGRTPLSDADATSLRLRLADGACSDLLSPHRITASSSSSSPSWRGSLAASIIWTKLGFWA